MNHLLHELVRSCIAVIHVIHENQYLCIYKRSSTNHSFAKLTYSSICIQILTRHSQSLVCWFIIIVFLICLIEGDDSHSGVKNAYGGVSATSMTMRFSLHTRAQIRLHVSHRFSLVCFLLRSIFVPVQVWGKSLAPRIWMRNIENLTVEYRTSELSSGLLNICDFPG